ncbi:hypothetical protein VTL71DRAFT_9186 [Oculimacula yallundae]|uniref:Fringe-like glycosyltransferase domain-containing protein n=1 Tax=Oculimacula yallundae TaxID=86028 RepID=A0ABR4BSB8_9HELO
MPDNMIDASKENLKNHANMQRSNLRRSSMVDKIASSRAPRCRLHTVLVATVMVLVWGFFFWKIYSFNNSRSLMISDKPSSPHHQNAPQAELPLLPQEINLEHLINLTHTPIFEYSRAVINTEHFKGVRTELTRINQRLLGPWTRVQETDIAAVKIPQTAPITLQIPLPPRADTRIFSFGMATTVLRLHDSLSGVSHWMSNSQAQLHILAPSDENATEMETSMRKASINATIHVDEKPFAQRYISLLKTLYDERSINTRWLVLTDDDTFFPSIASLASHLTQNYDSRLSLLIGAMSDDLSVIGLYGLSASGGGGIFISIPLAEQVLQEPTWSKCLVLAHDEGDELLNDCLNRFTSVRPVFDRALHQMDIYNGEGSSPEAGYLESGRELLSIHHWKTWFEFYVAQGAAVALATGSEGIFQRWLFDGDTVLSNGYSIVEYPRAGDYGGITEKELAEVEYTWNEGDPEELWRYVHMMGPLRPRKTSERKRSARLFDAVGILAPEGRAIRQIYVEKSQINTAFRPRERVVELVWLI